jgi:hypothetical protein
LFFYLFFVLLFFETIVYEIVFLNYFLVYSLLVYKNATDFYILILYPATLLKVFMMSGIFFVEFLGSLRYIIISSVEIIWFLPFLFEFLLLLPVLLLWLEILKLCWIRVGKVGTLTLFLTLEEMVSVFPHLVWCWL